MVNSKRIFREEVPEDLLLQLLQCVGVKGLSDYRFISKLTFTPYVCEKMDEVLILLQPYYLPHKHYLLQRVMTPARYIHIIRQVLRQKEIVLEVYPKGKITLYRITPKTFVGATTFEVSFE
jgi:hypothetical protein